MHNDPTDFYAWRGSDMHGTRCSTQLHVLEIFSSNQTVETLASRVLDDAYHFMDRLLRLLSKKHPAHKEYSHLFRETIFVRDGEERQMLARS